MEQFGNVAGTNIDGAIDAIETTIMMNTVCIPSSDTFRARVDSK